MKRDPIGPKIIKFRQGATLIKRAVRALDPVALSDKDHGQRQHAAAANSAEEIVSWLIHLGQVPFSLALEGS